MLRLPEDMRSEIKLYGLLFVFCISIIHPIGSCSVVLYVSLEMYCIHGFHILSKSFALSFILADNLSLTMKTLNEPTQMEQTVISMI